MKPLLPRHPRAAARRSHQSGIALVMVLWLLVLMTVIASSHSRNIRTETRLALNHVESSKARHLAEAAVYHAIMEVLVADDRARWPIDGSVQYIRFGDGDAAIEVRDARGLVDINSASARVLDEVLAGAGIDDVRQRQALVDATLDWRDPDQLKRLHGAEDNDYRNAGLAWAARDGPFTSIEEFRYILGMTNSLFARLAPYLTVYSGQPNVHVEFAPRWLAEIFDANRASVGARAPVAAGGAATLHITARAATMGGTTATLGAVVQTEPGGEQPFRILSWRVPASLLSETSAGTNDQPDNAT